MLHLPARFTFLALCSSSLLAAACGGSGSDAGIAVSARNGAAIPVAHDARGTAFTVDQGLLHLRNIELDLPAGLTCADVEGQLVGATCEPADACMFDPADLTYKTCTAPGEGRCTAWGNACRPASGCWFNPADGLHHSCSSPRDGSCGGYGDLCAP